MDLPTFNQHLAVEKSSITDIDIFKDYLALQDLSVAVEEPDYLIVTGKPENLAEFAHYWQFYLND